MNGEGVKGKAVAKVKLELEYYYFTTTALPEMQIEQTVSFYESTLLKQSDY